MPVGSAERWWRGDEFGWVNSDLPIERVGDFFFGVDATCAGGCLL